MVLAQILGKSDPPQRRGLSCISDCRRLAPLPTCWDQWVGAVTPTPRRLWSCCGPSVSSLGHSGVLAASPSWFPAPHDAVLRPGQRAEPGQCLHFLRACRGHPLWRLRQQMAPVAVSQSPQPAGSAASPHLAPRLGSRPAPRPQRPAGHSRPGPHDLAPHRAGSRAPAD